MKSSFCFLFILLILANVSADNNSNTKITNFMLDDRPFRMQKVNLLWEKAKKRLSVHKLADLYADLHVHDKHEAALKKYRIEDMDKDGLKEAQVKMAFREIIEKYGLEDLFGTDGHLSNQLPLDLEKDVIFSDKKLQSMWQRAEQAGFTVRDLNKLKEEFWHQQMKIDEINFLKQEMEIEDIADNELEDPRKTVKTAEQLKKLTQDMKTKHKNIRSGYYDLEAKFSQFDRDEPEFQDLRVQQLWALAKKTNWDQAELESFKEELKHFEARLKKHEFLENQLLQSSEALKPEEEHNDKHQQLKEKTKDIGFKVKKLHGDLKAKVSKAFSQHTEL